MKNSLQGTGVALITPFNQKKEIDFHALERLIDHVVTGGVDYLVALGTTAETPTLSKEERNEVTRFILEKNAGKLPVVLGIGGNDTREVIRNIENCDLSSVAAVLSVTPYYNKPSQQGLYEHYKALAGVSPSPIMLYNVPGRTGVNMTAETTLRLAREVDNLIGVKEASGSLTQMSYILRDKPDDFMVISGDDNMALPLIALGGDGVISVAANAFPEVFCRMVELCLAGDFAEAARIQLDCLECIEALFAEGNPVGIKAALAVKGIIGNELRLPLVSSSHELFVRIAGLIEKYGL